MTTPQKKRKHRVLPYPSSPFAPWSYGLIQQEADRRVADLQRPDIETSRRTERADIGALEGSGRAASSILQKIAPAQQQAYIQAARELSSLGGGLSAGLRSRIAADRSGAEKFSAEQGAPAPAPTVDPNAVTDTLQYGGTVIPGSSLESQGAAATAANEGLVGASAIKTQADVASRLQQGEQELLDLAAKRPELRDQILEELYKRELDKMSTRLQSRQVAVQEQAQALYGKQFGETVRHHVASEKNADQKFNLQVSKYQTAIDKAAADNRQPDASLSKAYGHIVDSNGDPILDKHGNKIPVATKGAKGGGLTPAQQRTNTRMAGTAANKLYADSHPGPPDFIGGPPTPPKHKMTFAQAQRYLVVTYSINRSKARQLLVAAGWKPDGRRSGVGGRATSGNAGGRH